MGMTRKSSPISMQMKGSNLDRHTPRVYTSYAARYPDAGRATDLDIEKACPWPMEEYERALNYDLPKPVAQALDGWMKASQATAIITALLAAVQGGMFAVIGTLPASDDSPLWRTFRGLVYAGLFFDFGATASSVYIIVQGAALPILARRKAMDAGNSRSDPYLQVHESGHMMRRHQLDGRHGLQIIEEFGMDRLWKYVAHHMLWTFVLGYVCLVLSVIIWVVGKESKELIIPVCVVAVGAGFPYYGFLRFMTPF